MCEASLIRGRAIDIAASQEIAKNDPDLSYLIGLRSAISILHLMNTCIRTVLIPLATANVTIRRDMEKTANLAMDRMEEKVNSIMQRSIDVAITWVTKLLARQNKSDFRPRDDALSGGGAWLEQLQTPVCIVLRSPNANSLLIIAFRRASQFSTSLPASTTLH